MVCSASTQETSDRTKNLPPSCSNLPKDLNSHDHQSSPNSTNQFVLSDQPVIHEHRLLSQQEGPSSEKFLSVDCVSKEPPDSTVQEFEIGSFALNTSADKMMESHQTDLDAPAGIQFNPEDFNFDIGTRIYNYVPVNYLSSYHESGFKHTKQTALKGALLPIFRIHVTTKG